GGLRRGRRRDGGFAARRSPGGDPLGQGETPRAQPAPSRGHRHSGAWQSGGRRRSSFIDPPDSRPTQRQTIPEEGEATETQSKQRRDGEQTYLLHSTAVLHREKQSNR